MPPPLDPPPPPRPHRDRLNAYGQRLAAWAQTERGGRILRWGRRLFSAAVLGGIVYQLSGIGWGEVLTALPTHPAFYLLLLVGYAALPVTESIVYGRLWGLAPRQGFRVFLRKRIYNLFVVDYSGEVYLYWWARKATGRPAGQVARDVRDVNILSNAASVLIAVTLFGGLLGGGYLDLEAVLGAAGPAYWVGGGFLAALVIALALRFRKHVFSLPARVALLLLGLYVAQAATIYLVRLGQWSIGVPGVALTTWLVFLAAAVAIERLPLLPSKELLFVGASVEMARALDVGAASVAGVMLCVALGNQAVHLIVYIWLILSGDRPSGAAWQPPGEPVMASTEGPQTEPAGEAESLDQSRSANA